MSDEEAVGLSAMGHRLSVEGSYNLRDLGGYPALGGVTRPRVFIRAGNLDKLPTTSQQQLIDYGVKTVLDLRDEWEAEQFPNAFAQSQSLSYANVPLLGNRLRGDAAWKAETENYGRLDELYCTYLDHCQPQIRTIFAALAESSPAAVFHCHAGKDRTGIIAALLLGAVGVPDPLIAEDYAQSNGEIQHLIAEWRTYAVQHGQDMAAFERDVASDAATMMDMLGYLKRQYGGVVGYLQACGVTESQRALLQQLFVQPDPC